MRLTLTVFAALVVTLLTFSAPTEAQAGCKNQGAEAGEVTKKRFSKSVLCLINKERKQRGIGSLESNNKLKKAAKRHSRVMVGESCFSHQCPGEADLEGRLRDVGYLHSGLSSWIYGENVVWGSGPTSTPKQVVRAWMSSASHKSNILHSSFKDTGIGVVFGAPERGVKDAVTVTQDFGGRS